MAVRDNKRDVWPVWLAEKDKRVCAVCGQRLIVTRQSLEFRHPDDGSGPPKAFHTSCLPRAKVVMV